MYFFSLDFSSPCKGGMLVHCSFTPPSGLNVQVSNNNSRWREELRVEWLAQEHNTVTPTGINPDRLIWIP